MFRWIVDYQLPNLTWGCGKSMGFGWNIVWKKFKFGGVRKIIGIVFAAQFNPATNQVQYGLANRIDKVVEQMSISPWTGNTVNFSNTGATQTYILGGRSANETIVVGSDIYWQSGLI